MGGGAGGGVGFGVSQSRWDCSGHKAADARGASTRRRPYDLVVCGATRRARAPRLSVTETRRHRVCHGLYARPRMRA